jgi:hypothetical protein
MYSIQEGVEGGRYATNDGCSSTPRPWRDQMPLMTARKPQRGVVPRLQCAPSRIPSDNFSRNYEVITVGAANRSNPNGWKSHDKIGTGVLAAAAVAAMALTRQLSFSSSANVANNPGLSSACRLGAATSEDRIVTTIAVLRGAGFEGEGASKPANR